jgi:KDO2-lipid IV(A) lauroyltransferase
MAPFFFARRPLPWYLLNLNRRVIRPTFMRNWLEYILFICTASLVRTLPRTAALSLGGWIGQLARQFQKRRAGIARENLQQALPELSPEELSAAIGGMFRHMGICFVDMLRLDKYHGQRDLERYFSINGIENLHEALALGRGCLIITGHIGFWEAGTFVLPQTGFTFEVVAKPMHNPLVDAFFARMRQASGTALINSHNGARHILKSLKNNHVVGLLLDQHIKGPGSVAAPFFGRPAHTTTIITQMATRYRIPIITAYSYRRSDNNYEIRYDQMFFLEGDLSAANILANTTLLNQKLEQAIRHDISQWFWLHRRWRPCCGT